MKRRTLLLGIAAIATYSYWDDIKTIVGGHTKDLTTRITHTDEIISGGILATGMINEDARGQDPVHNSSGTIGIVSANDGKYVQIGSDFKSSPGPDYHVYISLGGNIDDEQDFNLFKHFELGPLKSGKGASYYSIPEDVYAEVNHLSRFSVVIWCKRFGAYIGSATMKWDSNDR